MTRRPHGWRLGLLALVGMLMMLIAPALPVAAQGDPATDFETTLSQLSGMTPVAGPLSGSIDAANAQTVPAGVSVANGAAHAEFVVPAVNAGTLWAIAMEFRVSEAGKNFLLVFPDGTWQLDNGVQGGGAKGDGATFDTTAGATVALDVIFNGASGSFGIDGAFVSALDLSAVQGAGDVNLTGYLGLGAGATTLDYTNFSVYDLQGGAVAPTATAGGTTGVPTESATVAVPSAEATTGTSGDPATVFNDLLVQEQTQPMVFGPASGAMIHDPERVTFEQTGVTVTDFGVHIQCTAPRTAAELWDCGLAFRDTSTPDHYRLGVVSDGHWFLSVGAGDPLQQGEGIPIPPNAGDAITLDLFVQGPTGYFGVDGNFVAELDLSQIPGPGTVAAVVGFFNETYVPNGQTAFEDFYVSSFDQGVPPAVETPTTAAGVPTEAPTVAIPPAETPTTAAGLPTEAPTVAIPPAETPTPAAGLPTETPVAGTTAVVETTPATGDLPGVDAATNSYTSPTFGYQLTWDPTWHPVTASSQDAFDVLRITNDVTTTDLYSGASTMSLEQCITTLVEYYQGNASYANVVQVPYADGQTILVQGNVAIATLTFDYADAGTTTAITDSVICVSLPAAGALVTMESYIPTADYATQIDAVHALEAQFVVDGTPVVLPVVPGNGGVPTVAPTTEAVPTAVGQETAVAVPTVASAGSATFSLAGIGSSVSGIGTIDGQARSVNVSAILIGAEPGSSVGIARGTCAELATVLEPDYFVGEVTETGIVQGSVPVSLTVLQSRGPYAVVVYGPGEGAAMVACGEISVG
jgi:hypothetical protein